MKNVVLLLIVGLIFTACKKDPEIPFCELHPDECVDIREVKYWFYFKHGSYWVYEEENNGKRDSVYVVETWTDTGSYQFETRLHSTYDGYDYPYWTNGAVETDNNIVRKADKSTSVKRSKTKPGDFVAEDRCFLFYPKVGMWGINIGDPLQAGDTIKIESIEANLNMGGMNFHDVVCVHETRTAVEELQETYHYFAKSVGLIKKELIDSNQVWNLVNYHIEN